MSLHNKLVDAKDRFGLADLSDEMLLDMLIAKTAQLEIELRKALEEVKAANARLYQEREDWRREFQRLQRDPTAWATGRYVFKETMFADAQFDVTIERGKVTLDRLQDRIVYRYQLFDESRL